MCDRSLSRRNDEKSREGVHKLENKKVCCVWCFVCVRTGLLLHRNAFLCRSGWGCSERTTQQKRCWRRPILRPRQQKRHVERKVVLLRAPSETHIRPFPTAHSQQNEKIMASFPDLKALLDVLDKPVCSLLTIFCKNIVWIYG